MGAWVARLQVGLNARTHGTRGAWHPWKASGEASQNHV